MLVLGINTGTSIDAVDLALVEWRSPFDLKDFSIVAEDSFEFDFNLKQEFEKIINKQNANLDEISDLNYDFSKFLASLVQEFSTKHSQTIDLIGLHGQTIFHGGKSTWQLGDGSIIANILDIDTVSDFRGADIARGGCGAPLISFLDERLIRSNHENIATLNIGGIANITVMEQGKITIAYDTGPGNTLIDNLCQKLYNQSFDKDGHIAYKGKVNEKFVENLINNTEYFKQEAPKSTGRELFNHKYADKFLDLGNTQNIISSASYLTVKTISQELKKYNLEKVYISGGGIKNKFIIEHLKQDNPQIKFETHDETGIKSQYKEAILFSLLAYTSYNKIPNNVPSSTGASSEAILGKISYGNARNQ